MVQIPRLATTPADNGGVVPAVARDNERPTVLAGLPGGNDGVERNPPTTRAVTTRPGATPDAPNTQPPSAVKRALGIVGGYTAGQIVGAGVVAALGFGLGPILLVGVLAGVAGAKAADNYITTGRFW